METKQIEVCYMFPVLLYIRCLCRYNKEKTENQNSTVCTGDVCG